MSYEQTHTTLAVSPEVRDKIKDYRNSQGFESMREAVHDLYRKEVNED
jgi:hypothetical protein